MRPSVVAQLPIGLAWLVALMLATSATANGGEAGRDAISGAPGHARLAGTQIVRYVDTHAHLLADEGSDCAFEGAIEDALRVMDRFGVQRTLIMRPPLAGPGCDTEELSAIVRRRPGRFSFLGGGATLNPMIQQAARSGDVTEETVDAFQRAAAAIIEAGAVGFGEMAATHLSYGLRHPFEEAPPDHPLFFLLADLAAQFDVPVDLHMDTVPEDMAWSDQLLPAPSVQTNNPRQLHGNIEPFERLLNHNPTARIVWAHVGGDGTGQRSPELVRRLLEAHPNLYAQVKATSGDRLANSILVDGQGPAGPGGRRPPGAPQRLSIAPEWLELIRAFPDRFVIGSDRFYHPPGVQPAFANFSSQQENAMDQRFRAFVDLLPSEFAARVASENAARVFRLN